MDDNSSKLPTDDFSRLLREALADPHAIVKVSTIDLQDFYGNAETWNVRTIRAAGRDTVFLQRINAKGGERWVLPAEVADALERQRSGVVDVANRRRARSAAATRKAKARS